MRRHVFLKTKWGCFFLTFVACLGLMQNPAWTEKVVDSKKAGLPPGLYALFVTSKGPVVVELFYRETPLTVDNFIGLASGTKMWLDPETLAPVRDKSIYEHTLFHRVIPNFMIQGGDPTGTGRGGPGYKFKDEIVPDTTFDRPGRLAMANSGPHSNGSQFFISLVPTPWLNGKHTIFGQVIQGQAVVNQIANVDRDEDDRPIKDVLLERVEVFKVEAAVAVTPDAIGK